MFGNKPSAEQQQSQTTKEEIAKRLRLADEHFRYNRFDEALAQVELALQLDSKNLLARSFKERIILMQKRAQSSAHHEKERMMTEEEKQALIARLLASAEEYIRQNNFNLALAKVAEVYKIDGQNAFARAYSDRIEELMQEQKAKAEKIFNISPKQEQRQNVPALHGAFFMYRELLRESWMDGKITPEEEEELKRVRGMFNITDKEHAEIEREVKLSSYLDALRVAWRDGVLTANERQVLELMRQRYGITAEEHASLESQIQEVKKGSAPKATILIVDPDKDHRTSLFGFLKQHNYEVLVSVDVEEALHKIVMTFPHLVLAEVTSLPTRLDGFALYKKLQEHETLKNIPFFFMTSVRNEKVIRAAMRMGLDMYFPKPVDHELLLAAIEGKLNKR